MIGLLPETICVQVFVTVPLGVSVMLVDVASYTASASARPGNRLDFCDDRIAPT
jgi:hypothetical protein